MCTIVIPEMGGEIRVPDWVVDLDTFHRWVDSEEVAERARISYLRGEVWVDMSEGQLFSHNQVKTEYAIVLGGLAKTGRRGRCFIDGVRVSNVEAGLSHNPDGVFVLQRSLDAGRVRLVRGTR